MMPLQHATRVPRETPVGAAARGAGAGLAATLVLSGLARVLPGMSNQVPPAPSIPPSPDDPEQVRAWQERAQSPAAYKPHEGNGARSGGASPGATPAGALTQPQAPGPEGLAEQFAFKVASGIFDTDVTPYMRPAGLAVHFLYGSAWGVLYGLLQATYRRPPSLFGALYGLLVWLVGPAVLVPTMKLMGSPAEEPPLRTAMMVAGHIAYGVTLATTFEALERKAG